MIALPIAVARCSWKRSIAAYRSSLLRVGACATVAVPANATMAMRTLPGCSAMKAFAAACEAARRLGSTSFARMLPETSMARITVSCCAGRVTTAVGRAMAMTRQVTARKRSAGGTWRRQLAAPIAWRTSARSG
jgi:hypothetical protein